MSSAAYRWGVTLLTLLLGAILTLWALLTPGFRAPDEPQHYNSVLRLATGGGWPAPGEAPISDATLLAAREAGFLAADQPLSLFSSTVLPRGTFEGWGGAFAQIVPTPPQDRAVLDHTAELEDTTPPAVDQMTQHPPLYYALAAGVIRGLGALDWRWDQQLLALRLLSAAIAVWSVPLIAAVAREATGSRVTGLVAAAAAVGIGQFAHINASVTNDSLTTVLGLAVTLLAARALTRPYGVARPIVTGLVLGAGLLTKGFLLAAIPLVAIAYLVPTRSSPTPGRRLVAALLAEGTAFVVGGWWWLRNLLVHGTLQPSGQPPLEIPWGDDTPTVREYVADAVPLFNESFWGNFGWLEVPLPVPLVTALGLVTAALIVGSLTVRSPVRARLGVLLTYPVLTLVIVAYGGIVSYYDSGLFGGHQGRYLFPALGALLAATAAAAVYWAGRARPGLARGLPAITGAGALLLAGYSLFVAFQGFYQPRDQNVLDGLVRWESWSPFSREVLALAAVAPVVLGLAAILVLRVAGRSGTADVAALVGRVTPSPRHERPGGRSSRSGPSAPGSPPPPTRSTR